MTPKPNKTTVEETRNEKEEHGQLFDAARRVHLAGIGAVALAQDEVEDFVDRLVERGEIAEKESRMLINEVLDRRTRQTAKVEDEMSKRVAEILDRMNVPTKADIEALSEKIAALTKKVEELRKEQS